MIEFATHFGLTIVIWAFLTVPIGWIYLVWKKQAKDWRESFAIIKENVKAGNRTSDDNRALNRSILWIVAVGSILFSLATQSNNNYFEGLSVEIIGTFMGFYLVLALEEIIRGHPRLQEEILPPNIDEVSASIPFEPQTSSEEVLPFD